MAAIKGEDFLGELRVCHVSDVRMLLPTKSSNPVTQAVGHLVCSNFRLKFIPLIDKLQDTVSTATKLEIYFGSIQTVCSVSGYKRRLLDPKNTLPRNLDVIEITCKDFKRVSFSFKNCRKNEAYSMMNAVLVYSHPQTTSLFAFDYVKELRKDELEQSTLSIASDHSPVTFLNARDWEKELQRLGWSPGTWRVCEINRTFTFSDSLPPYFVVPESVADQTLYHVARQHHGNRLPVWCWSHPKHGTSILRCSSSISSESDKPSDMNYIWATSHGRTMKPFDLSTKCCTVKDVTVSFNKLRELCMPVTEHDIKNVERRWLSLLNSCRWLELVRSCLEAAVEVQKVLCEACSVLLIEADGRDISCLISSLVQLMCDPHCRSVIGFEMLIQKEWVAMGHPFCSRNKLTSSFKGDDETDTSQAPVFLLFLDCVWQFTEQFPSAFAFSSVYLKQLHICSLSNLYGTFVFDSCRDMYDVVNGVQPGGKKAIQKPLTIEECAAYLESAWGKWTNQLSSFNDKEDVLNPLYYLFSSQAKEEPHNAASPLPIDYGFVSIVVDDEAVEDFLGGLVGLYDTPGQEAPVRKSHQSSVELVPNTCSACIKFWSQLFLSGFPDLSEPDSHKLHVQRHQSVLVCQIRKQRDKLHMSELASGSFAFDLINHETSHHSFGSQSGGSSEFSPMQSPLPTAISRSNGDIAGSPLTTHLSNGIISRRDTYHGDETSVSHSPLTRSLTSTPQGSRIVRGKVTIKRERDSKKKQDRHMYTASDSPPIITTKDTTRIKTHTPVHFTNGSTESHYL